MSTNVQIYIDRDPEIDVPLSESIEKSDLKVEDFYKVEHLDQLDIDEIPAVNRRAMVNELLENACEKEFSNMLGKKMTVLEVTPNVAKLLLSVSVGNRVMSNSVIQKYAKYMKNGEWREKRSELMMLFSIFLANGHHRLHAVIVANVTVRMIVELDAEKIDMRIVDDFYARSIPAQATLETGRRFSGPLTNAVKFLWLFNQGITISKWRKLSSRERVKYVFDAQVLIDEYNKYDQYFDEAERYMNSIKMQFPKQHVFGYAFAILHQIDHAKAQEFFDRLKDGQNISGGLLMVRNKLITMKNNSTSARLVEAHVVEYFIFKGWEWFNDEQPKLPKKLEWRANYKTSVPELPTE